MHSLQTGLPLRSFSSVAAAALVTLALLYLMTTLIESSYVELEVAVPMLIDFVRVPEETPHVDVIKKVTKPEPPEITPELPNVRFKPGPIETGGTAMTLRAPPTSEIATAGLVDGMHLPLVKVQPAYPRTAAQRGIEGYTIIEFDIAADGSVRNPRVIESDPGDIFNRASLKAVLKFRYKPMIENGNPVMVMGAQTRFTFELEKRS